MLIWIIIGIIIVLALIFVGMYNSFIKLKNSCDEAYSTMDVYLKKRFDLIPNLVETVKGYAAHEKETLQNVIAARNNLQNASTTEEKLAGENALQGTLKTLFAVAEAYPDLKANTNFLDLQDQLKGVENDIANSRKYYNAVVKQFNTKCEMFPSNIIAGICHFEKKPMFEVDSAEERKNVEVKF
ncbi:MAG: LemA family protein [Firmicutes bacterium]|nr:LemA family protein [Bacillota bacterium]